MTGPIAYLTGEYPRATDTFIQREVAGLRALGFSVHTCSVRRTGPEHHVGPEQRAEAATTFNVLPAATRPLRLLRAHASAATRAPGRYVSALRLAWRTAAPGFAGHLYNLFYFAEAAVLAEHLRGLGVTHLHNHIAKSSCTLAMLTSEMSGIPFSFTLHGPDIFFEPHRWRLDEKIARARFVACISHFCRSQGMAFADPAHWNKLHIVHCAVDPARYAPRSRQGNRLTFVGRLAGVKGVPVLFDAMERLGKTHPALHLTLIGDGPERAALEGRARAAGLAGRIAFAGYQAQEAVAATLAETDIFVLPSFAEGVPVVLMEAMAAQCAVVATRIAGIPELIADGETGLLVPPGDAAALAEALAALLDDPARRKAMGRAARAMVEAEFDLAREPARLATLFRAYGETGGGGLPPTLRPEPMA